MVNEPVVAASASISIGKKVKVATEIAIHI
jgi:hypothetical protein